MANKSIENVNKSKLLDTVVLTGGKPSGASASGWEAFKSVFFGKFGTVALESLLTSLFAAPGLVALMLFYLNSSVAVGLLPYSANFGIGYPVISYDVDAVGILVKFYYNIYAYLSLIPAIALFAVGISGNMYVMNKLVSGEEVKPFKDFFRGIRQSGLSAFVIGLLFGIIVFITGASFGYADALGLHVAVKVISIIVSMIILVLAAMFVPYFMAQGAAFKLTAGVRIKNSVRFMFGAFFQTLIFTVLAVAPHMIIFIPGFTAIYVMLFVLMGVSFTTLVFTVNCRQCFDVVMIEYGAADKTVETKRDKAVNDVEPIAEPEQKTEPRKKPSQPVRYKNPKKSKRTDGEN